MYDEEDLNTIWDITPAVQSTFAITDLVIIVSAMAISCVFMLQFLTYEEEARLFVGYAAVVIYINVVALLYALYLVTCITPAIELELTNDNSGAAGGRGGFGGRGGGRGGPARGGRGAPRGGGRGGRGGGAGGAAGGKKMIVVSTTRGWTSRLHWDRH